MNALHCCLVARSRPDCSCGSQKIAATLTNLNLTSLQGCALLKCSVRLLTG